MLTKNSYWTLSLTAIAVSHSLSVFESIQLFACHPLPFESFVFAFLHYFGLRRFRLNESRRLISRCQEDVSCNIYSHVLLCSSSLQFLQLLHHLLLTHSGCRGQSDLSPVLEVCEKEGDKKSDIFFLKLYTHHMLII